MQKGARVWTLELGVETLCRKLCWVPLRGRGGGGGGGGGTKVRLKKGKSCPWPSFSARLTWFFLQVCFHVEQVLQLLECLVK